MPLILEHYVLPEESGATVERLLKKHFDISSGLMCFLKYNERLFLNGKVCRTVDVASVGDKVAADIMENIEDNQISEYNHKLDIIFEDEYILVVNKPGNMESHPCHSNYETTLANTVMYYWRRKNEHYNYHIVNRLDKDTSGICVIAKNRYSHGNLSKQMIKGEFKKRYFAAIHGHIEPEQGRICLPIQRQGESIIKREVNENGQYAETLYKTVIKCPKYSGVEIELKTGRTHQIRVHFSHLKHPLVGDWLYGNGDNERQLISRQALHSYQVELIHPVTKERLIFTADVPAEITKLFDGLY